MFFGVSLRSGECQFAGGTAGQALGDQTEIVSSNGAVTYTST